MPWDVSCPATDSGAPGDYSDRRRVKLLRLSEPARARAWPGLVILFDDALLAHPATCPHFGRDCTPSNIIRFVTRRHGS